MTYALCSKDVAAIEKNRDISVETKREQLVDMLDKLHVHQERLFVSARVSLRVTEWTKFAYAGSVHWYACLSR